MWQPVQASGRLGRWTVCILIPICACRWVSSWSASCPHTCVLVLGSLCPHTTFPQAYPYLSDGEGGAAADGPSSGRHSRAAFKVVWEPVGAGSMLLGSAGCEGPCGRFLWKEVGLLWLMQSGLAPLGE